MTGFGSFEIENEQWRIKTEIKSLNNKFFDLNLRLPKSFKDKDIELRQDLSNKIGRGSVSVHINAEHKLAQNTQEAVSLNTELAQAYHQKIQALANTLQLPSGELLHTIIHFPDVLKYEEQSATEQDWLMMKQCVDQAFLKFDAFRIQEGNTIRTYLLDCVSKIRHNVQLVEQEEAPRKASVKGKLLQSLKDNQEDNSVDHNRFEQELIYYLEKYDIGEEKSRLYNHLDFFIESLDKDPNGKKLNFIAQEMGREINTMGSKAYYFPIQQLVVFMKEELEKIKEQLLNVL